MSYQTQYSPSALRCVGLACLKPDMFLALHTYSPTSWGRAPGSTSSPATPKEACEPLGHLGAVPEPRDVRGGQTLGGLAGQGDRLAHTDLAMIYNR